MRLRPAAALLLALASSARAQTTGRCTGNTDASAEPDVSCGTGYSLVAAPSAVDRGAGASPDSAEALAACCERIFCSAGVCNDGKILVAGAATSLPTAGSEATDAVCCEEDYEDVGCMSATATAVSYDQICVSCLQPDGLVESGDGGYQLTATPNADGTVTLVVANANPAINFQGFLMKATAGSFVNLPATAQYKDCAEVGGGDDSPGGRHYHSAIVQRTTENMQSITITWRPSAFARRTGTGRIVLAVVKEPTVWFPVGIRTIESVIPDPSFSLARDAWAADASFKAAGDHCTDNLCTNCISPFQSDAQSGTGGYSLAVAASATPNVLELTLSGSSSFKNFMLKTSGDTYFEWLPDAAMFKDCTADGSSSSDSPGGTEIGQSITAATSAGKLELVVELAYPAGATEFTVTAIVMKTDQEWYGWVQTVVPPSPPPEPRVDGTANVGGSHAVMTLTSDMAAFDAAGGEAEFVDELAEILSIPAARVRVIEVREGSVIISFGILVGAAGEKTPAEAMTELQGIVASPTAAWSATALLSAISPSDGLEVLSPGGDCPVVDATGLDEECTKCKSAGAVVVMLLTAVLIPLSTVILCVMKKLRRRVSVQDLDEKYEGMCKGYDSKTNAKQMMPQELKEKMASGEKLYIIDTRGRAEHETSFVKGAQLLEPPKGWAPGKEMKWSPSELQALENWPPPEDATVVCHCTAGLRSGFAAVALSNETSREVWNLHGGIIQWANEQGSVVDPKGNEVKIVNTFGANWAPYVHKADGLKPWYKGYVEEDEAIRAKPMVKLFLVMLLLMVVVLIFALVDIPRVYTLFIEEIQDMGAWGPVVAAIAWIPVCLFFVPGLILSLSTGFAFPFPSAFLSVLIGATVGATCAAVAGRYLARESVEGMLANWPKFRAVDRAISDEGWKVVLLLRLSPVIPFNLLNYALGTTGVPILHNFVATFFGMAPGTAMFVYIGSTLRNLADALRGDLSGGGEGSDTMRLVALIVGLVATVVVTVFITIVAKKKLATYVDEEAPADGVDDKVTSGEQAAAPTVVEVAEATSTGFDTATAAPSEPPVRHYPPEPAWKIRAGCGAGWALLALSIVGFVLATLHKPRVELGAAPSWLENDDLFVSAADVKAAVDAGTATILDARGSFGDHIPGAQSTKWQDFSGGAKASQLLPQADLEAALTARGVSNSKQVIVYGDWSALSPHCPASLAPA